MKLSKWIWIFAFLVCWPSMLLAQPIYAAESNGVRIVLTDEPCKLPAVTNLPYRATWTEKGKTFEGCFGVSPMELVMGYFDDRTVAVMPVQVFQRVQGI